VVARGSVGGGCRRGVGVVGGGVGGKGGGVGCVRGWGWWGVGELLCVVCESLCVVSLLGCVCFLFVGLVWWCGGCSGRLTGDIRHGPSAWGRSAACLSPMGEPRRATRPRHRHSVFASRVRTPALPRSSPPAVEHTIRAGRSCSSKTNWPRRRHLSPSRPLAAEVARRTDRPLVLAAAGTATPQGRAARRRPPDSMASTSSPSCACTVPKLLDQSSPPSTATRLAWKRCSAITATSPTSSNR